MNSGHLCPAHQQHNHLMTFYSRACAIQRTLTPFLNNFTTQICKKAYTG